MLAAMISDAHLSGLDDPNQARLVSLLDGLEVERLFVLGDLFHFWWGFRGVVYGEFVPVLAALHRLRARGTAITYVPGNHDFALGPFFTDELGVEVRQQARVRLGGVEYLLAHGDESDRSWQYALTRGFLRGPVFRALMWASGPERARRIGLGLAGASREHAAPDAARAAALLQAQQDWASEQLQGDVDVVVAGHIHQPGVWELPGGRLVNTGDFCAHYTWLAVGEGGFSLERAGD